jgi:hypothetical protein
MGAPFPFGLPGPTAAYLVFYLATLWIHIAFMNYVLAGSATLAAGLAVPRLRGHAALEILRDWMPFMLSAAITAGIAPLLFLQVLYKEQFYTANLLLFLRWMAILPALILGFYLGYLLKKEGVRSWPAGRQVAVGAGVFACFAFVGWSWVENHLLSVAPEAQWREQYASGAHRYRSSELGPRLLLWFVAAFPTMALMVGWQLWDRVRRRGSDPAVGASFLAWIALAGIAASSLWAWRYYHLLGGPAQKAVAGAAAKPYFALSIAGGALEFLAWAAILRKGRFTGAALGVASAGLVANFVGTGVMNETIRLATLETTIGLAALTERHAVSWKVGGLPVFLVFLALNAGLMAWCVRRVRRLPAA